MRRFALIAILLAAGFLAQPGFARAQTAPLVTFKHDLLSITGPGGTHQFAVELATDNNERSQGLMYRQSMAADAGMLFLYDHAQPVVMWMENTVIPLDMLFIGTDGRIVNIRERAVPYSRENIPSEGPVKAVLELNGGIVSRFGIKPGDLVTGPGLGR